MNIAGMINLWITILGALTLIMAICNPFFEDRRLLALTSIPFTLCLLLATYAVGWVW